MDGFVSLISPADFFADENLADILPTAHQPA
jgi:hypothetical protein